MEITMNGNPFEFDAAANLPPKLLHDIYIEDHNCSRFILSNRNVYLLGERGSGKSMMLIYHSLKQKILNEATSVKSTDFSAIGIYVQCKRPLFNKPEYLLLQNSSQASALSEHYLVLDILHSIAKELMSSHLIIESMNHEEMLVDLEYLLGIALPKKANCLESISLFVQKVLSEIESFPGKINAIFDKFPMYSFQSLIVPVLDLFRTNELLKKSHFMIMIDDAHDLNSHQIKRVNSWISYRDNSLFSIKVATANVHKHSFETDFGGLISEGHDFYLINMEKALQNSASPFYKLAKKIVEKRLSLIGLESVEAETFFPMNKSMEESLKRCEAVVTSRGRANGLESKKLSDYIYKNKRVEYFRERKDKANRPPYSGFETLVHTSTGVIRNLLAPIYEMYELAYSDEGKVVKQIDPKYQTAVLMDVSERLWADLRARKLADKITECSEEQAIKLHSFLECLGDLFAKRLKEHKSEPRVLTFTISASTRDLDKQIEPILAIARKALLLYERTGPAKDAGRRETVYVPNRILWLARGLDPVGQHGRVSIPAKEIIAAFDGKALAHNDSGKSDQSQWELDF